MLDAGFLRVVGLAARTSSQMMVEVTVKVTCSYQLGVEFCQPRLSRIVEDQDGVDHDGDGRRATGDGRWGAVGGQSWQLVGESPRPLQVRGRSYIAAPHST